MLHSPDRRVIYLATHSRHKQRELAAMVEALLPGRCEVRAAADIDPSLQWDETADSFTGNAAIKARAVAAALRKAGLAAADVLGDDSGLSVAALGGAPGIYSSRYGGPDTDDRRNRIHLVQELAARVASDHALASKVVDDPDSALSAHFTCALYWIDAKGVEHSFEGQCPGGIILSPRGAHGFGYDALFVAQGHGKTMAEMDEQAKNLISHRRRAVDQWLAAFVTQNP